eukprot:948788-Pyramimonas_sp.AAC.1
MFIKLRVHGGKLPIFSVYAPHSCKPLDARRDFYAKLGEELSGASGRQRAVVLGDFNARLHRRFAGESAHLGEYIFGNPAAQHNPSSNRTLLLELCSTHDF